MTRALQRETEREQLGHLLANEPTLEGWSLVPEPDDVDAPDGLVRWHDTDQFAAIEVTRATVEPLAMACGVQEALIEDLQAELTKRDIRGVQAFLSFKNATAIAVAVRKARRHVVKSLAEMITSRLPLSEYVNLPEEDLLGPSNEAVRTIHLLPSSPTEPAFVGRGGATSIGPQLGVLQRAIDDKAAKMSTYRKNAESRIRRAAPGSTLTGVWLVVVVGVGPGLSTSIDTRDAVARLHRSVFDRGFILDYFPLGPTIIELPPSGDPPT